MPSPLSANPQFWGRIAVALVAGGLLYLVSPILAPFLFAAILAYILDPIVERLTGKYLPRTLAVLLVLVGVLLLVGERIGLHPVAVIFALPASAALLVGLRHLRRAYLASALYGGAK